MKDTFGLERVTPSNVSTHQLGNTLDGVWTNMRTTSCTLHDSVSLVTDHSMVEVGLLIDKDVSRQLLQKIDECYTQKDIRNF